MVKPASQLYTMADPSSGNIRCVIKKTQTWILHCEGFVIAVGLARPLSLSPSISVIIGRISPYAFITGVEMSPTPAVVNYWLFFLSRQQTIGECAVASDTVKMAPAPCQV